MKSPPSVSVQILRLTVVVTLVAFGIAYALTALCYAADYHVVNHAKCALCASLWSIASVLLGGGGVVALWIEKLID